MVTNVPVKKNVINVYIDNI